MLAGTGSDGATGPSGFMAYAAVSRLSGDTMEVKAGLFTNEVKMDHVEAGLNVDVIQSEPSIIRIEKSGMYEVNWFLICRSDKDNIDVSVRIGENLRISYSDSATIIQKKLRQGIITDFYGSAICYFSKDNEIDMIVYSDNDVAITLPEGGKTAFLSIKWLSEEDEDSQRFIK